MGIERHRLFEEQPDWARSLGSDCVKLFRKRVLRRHTFVRSVEQGIKTEEAIESGMQEKRKEFVEQGAELYAKA